MIRRNFLTVCSGAAAVGAMAGRVRAAKAERIDAAWYQRSRRFAALPMSRVAYVEHGRGPAALFLHGYPLNGFQWRGALERLHPYRRCIAPDVMGMGFTQTPEGTAITPAAQVEMLAALLRALDIGTVDLVANDSGGLVAQLFVAAYPARARSLLLTNCDVDEDNPPAQFLPLVELARQGVFAERFLLPQANEKELARSPKGLGGLAYTYPDKLSDDAIETYLRPLVATPLRRSQTDQYAVALGSNALVAVREQLGQWKGPARMVWAMKDQLFGVEWAEWLDRKFPGSRGIRRVEGANLFFPEEMPDLIAEEAEALWGVRRR
ncbi:MAG TPA: alpha/beta hydrolase [Bryobacteraceae bacterium]|nr:alpha/beta hydrolase [Bryobacteraceae bacterium]